MTFNQNTKNLKLGHLNVRSLLTGFNHFSDLVIEHEFDIMCTSETWLNNTLSTDIVHIPNYKFYYKNREGRGGGVGIYVRTDLVCKEVFTDFTSIDGLEYLFLDVKISKLHLLICVFYRAPSNDAKLSTEHMDTLLSFITPQYDNIFFLGDINIDQLHVNCFAQCMSSYEFTQVVNEPTRVTNISQTLIDVIFVNNPEWVLNVGTINSDLISDHRMVYCKLTVELPRAKPKIITYRDFNKFSNNDFLADLKNINWNQIYYLNNIEDKISFLTEHMLFLFDKHAPYITSRITKRHAPWITLGIKQLMKDRNKAHSIYKKSKNLNDWLHYKQLRNMTVSAIRREKAAYLASFENLSSKEFWTALKNMNIKSNQKNEIPPNLNDCDGINNYFSSVFTPRNNCSESVNKFAANRYNHSLSFKFNFATVAEISTIISNLTSNASGCDGINAKMLKLCSPIISEHITHIINCCLEAGYFPKQWKLSLIRPLPKIKNPQFYSDLRPITIIPTLSKVLEKFIQIQIYNYAINHKIISDLQSGFRKGYSTTTVLANVTDDIFSTLDKGNASALVLLDFSKAFDTLDHDLLCAKLTYYGFDATSVNFFKNYLLNRNQVVLLEENNSNISSITSGVPQGSVLGPILFLIYTADILNHVKYSKVLSYADDTQLSYSFCSTDINIVSTQLNADLNSIYEYSKSNNLKLNSDKCAVMFFSSKNLENLITSNVRLFIHNVPLKVVNKIKNLGLIFENNLRFTEHVSLLVKKCYAALKLLYTNISILNFKMRKKLCETLVLPILHYCNIVYFPCLDNLTKNRLQHIQNTCCRFVFKLRKYDHVFQKINDLGWLRIENLFKYHLTVFVHRLLLTSVPPYLRNKISFRHDIHNINTRFPTKLDIPKYRLSLFRRSFSYNSVMIYNSLPVQYKSFSVNKFRSSVKLYYFLSQ